MKIKPRKVYLFYDQTELELVGLGTVYINCQSCHLDNLELKLFVHSRSRTSVLSFYSHTHDKVFAHINQNNLAQ